MAGVGGEGVGKARGAQGGTRWAQAMPAAIIRIAPRGSGAWMPGSIGTISPCHGDQQAAHWRGEAARHAAGQGQHAELDGGEQQQGPVPAVRVR